MKRDMDLIRDILLEIEKSDASPLDWINLNLPEQPDEMISYQVKLMDEAGLIEAIDLSTAAGYAWKPKRLTWSGHDFLDHIRDPEVWRHTKAGAQKIGSFSFDVVKGLAKAFVKKKIKDLTGGEYDL